MTATLEPILVLGKSRIPHKIVSALKDDTDVLRVTARVRGRACWLLHSLITEAERRGSAVRLTNHTHRSQHHQALSSESMPTVTIVERDFGVRQSR